MVTYFVLSIIVCVGMGILIILSGFWASSAHSYVHRYDRYLVRLEEFNRQQEESRASITTSTALFGIKSVYGHEYQSIHRISKPYYYGPERSTGQAVFGIHVMLGLMAFTHCKETPKSLISIL